MEPIDRRITAARLMALREEPGAARAIADVLGVGEMDPGAAVRTKEEIESFLASGDATVAAQIIHSAALRKPGRGAAQREAGG